MLPRADDAVEIAKALNTTVEYLVTGTDPVILPASEAMFFSKARRWRQVVNDLEEISPSMSKYFCETIHALAMDGRVETNGMEDMPQVGNQ